MTKLEAEIRFLFSKIKPGDISPKIPKIKKDLDLRGRSDRSLWVPCVTNINKHTISIATLQVSRWRRGFSLREGTNGAKTIEIIYIT